MNYPGPIPLHDCYSVQTNANKEEASGMNVFWRHHVERGTRVLYPRYSRGFQALSNLTGCILATTNQESSCKASCPIIIDDLGTNLNERV